MEDKLIIIPIKKSVDQKAIPTVLNLISGLITMTMEPEVKFLTMRED